MKEKLTFFLPDSIGGVSTVIRNLLAYVDTNEFECFVIKIRNTAQKRAAINFVFPNANTLEFQYSHFENIVIVYKRLYAFLPDPDSTIIATDALELGMAHYLKLPNKVIFVVLGDFRHYYNLALAHQDIIDLYIAISQEIWEKLNEILSHKATRIIKSYFPVPDIVCKNDPSETVLRVIFVGRFEESKGILLIPEIDARLKEEGVFVQWSLVGDGLLKQQITDMLSNAPNFTFMGFLSYSELIQEYRNHDLYLLPSRSEGLPISLIEAMKSGLVPIVSDIPGGVREIITDAVSGYLVERGDATKFSAAICALDEDRELLKQLRANALRYSSEQFNPVANTARFFHHVSLVYSDPLPKKITRSYVPANRLDRSYIPNGLVQLVRKIRSYFR